jgi:hypothetical protein
MGFRAAQEGRVTLWVASDAGSDADRFTDVCLEQEVYEFKQRVLRAWSLASASRLATLKLVERCDRGAAPTPAQLQAARPLHAWQTLSASGVRDGALLLLAVPAAPAALPAATPLAMLYPPSALCDARVWRRIQFSAAAHPAPPFACFRPPVPPPHALPAALLSPVFGAFLRTAAADDVRALGDCAAESAAVVRLVTLMPRVFDTQLARGRAFRDALLEFLDIQLNLLPTQPDDPSSSAACSDASCVHAAVTDAQALLVVQADTLELGCSGDPYFQGQAAYFRHWHAAERDGHAATAFAGDFRPALMIELVGPMLRVSALASMPCGRVVCEPLTPLLHLFALTGQREYMGRLVATLRALRDGVRALRQHYERNAAAAAAAQGSVAPLPAPPPPAAPYPLRDASRFSDVRPLAHGGKLLYEATWHAPPGSDAAAAARVCVKLTQRYAPRVHALWAGAALAPALHACEPLDGGAWCMVIMELLPPPTWRPLPELPPAERGAARAAALAALAAAHALRLPSGGGARCAHGDARGVNVLVARAAADSGSGGWHVRFVDFDWAGEEGADVYPPLMSTAVPWAPGARPGLPMLQAHDAHLLGGEQ